MNVLGGFALITTCVVSIRRELESPLNHSLNYRKYHSGRSRPMKHFYRDVPRLGDVAVSRHAWRTMESPEPMFEPVLLSGLDTLIGTNVVRREKDGLPIVLLTNPTRMVGAKLVKTVYRVDAPARVIAGHEAQGSKTLHLSPIVTARQPPTRSLTGTTYFSQHLTQIDVMRSCASATVSLASTTPTSPLVI